jgi:hypothetical protein
MSIKSHATTAITIATTKTISTTRVRKLSSSIHRRIVHQGFLEFILGEKNLGAAVPGLAPDTVASRARPSRKAELSHRLANGAGLSQFLQFRSACLAGQALAGWLLFGSNAGGHRPHTAQSSPATSNVAQNSAQYVATLNSNYKHYGAPNH